MEIIKINCNSCGANLDLPKKVNFFQCSFCGSNLKLVKGQDVLFTEVLDELKEQTESISQSAKIIQIEQSIERLDREWEMQKDRLGLEEKDVGTENSMVQVFGIVLAVGFVIFWIVGAVKMSNAFDSFPSHGGGHSLLDQVQGNRPSPPGGGLHRIFPIMGILVLIIVLIKVFSLPAKVSKFQEAREKYDRQRRSLLQELDEAKDN